MAFSTFSGPMRVGPQKDNTPARNTGLVVLTQSATVPFGAMRLTPTAQTLFVLPAGTKILGFHVEVLTAISGGGVTAVNYTFGRAGAAANLYATTITAPLTVGKAAAATVDAALQVAATNNVGAVDVTVTGTFTAVTGNPTAGSIVVTVEYIQRADDGSQNPAVS